MRTFWPVCWIAVLLIACCTWAWAGFRMGQTSVHHATDRGPFHAHVLQLKAAKIQLLSDNDDGITDTIAVFDLEPMRAGLTGGESVVLEAYLDTDVHGESRYWEIADISIWEANKHLQPYGVLPAVYRGKRVQFFAEASRVYRVVVQLKREGWSLPLPNCEPFIEAQAVRVVVWIPLK